MVLSTISIDQVLEQAGQEKARRLAALERAQAGVTSDEGGGG